MGVRNRPESAEDGMTAPKYPTLARLNAQVADLGEMTPAQETQIAICKVLAERLDRAMVSTTGAQSLAIPGLARQLEQSIAKLLTTIPASDDCLDEIFADENGSHGGFDIRVWKIRKEAERAIKHIMGEAL